MEPAIIVFRSDDGPLIYKFNATYHEYCILEMELSLYNDWIELLLNGEGPESSYIDPEEANQRYLVTHIKNFAYNKEFERPSNRALYEKPYYHFDIYTKGGECEESMDLIHPLGSISQITESTEAYTLDSFDSLKSIITGKFGDGFGMGYRLLPMMKRIIERNL